MKTIDDKTHDLCIRLWREYKPNLIKLCRFKLQSCPNDVDDIVAEAFLCFWKELESGVPPKNPKAWLYCVTNNLIKKRYTQASKEREKLIHFDEYEEYSLPVEYDFLDEMISDGVIEQLADQIKDELQPAEKDLLDYIYTQGLSMKNIAEILGCTPSAVKQRHYRLCRKIKKLSREKIEQIR